MMGGDELVAGREANWSAPKLALDKPGSRRGRETAEGREEGEREGRKGKRER